MVAVEVAHDDAVALASLVDLSHGGAFLELADPASVAIGVRVRVHLAVDGHDVNEEAKVVRVTSGVHAGCAVAWTAPGPEVAAVVDHVVEHTARLADELAIRLTDCVIDEIVEQPPARGAGRTAHGTGRQRRVKRHHPGARS